MNKVIKALFEKKYPNLYFRVLPISQQYADEDVAEKYEFFAAGFNAATEEMAHG